MVNRVILLALLVSMMSPISSLAADLKPADKRIDEILAFSIVNLYGSIGFTNYGYLDKVKPGIIKKLDSEEGGRCNTFLDDLVGAVAAAAAGKLAHNEPNRVQHAIAEE